ncbi:hypothetical protein NBRC116588_11010 [Pyruvatibacter sp. HU-CL02332]|uniref:two-partner secretion domain-containing protein n=1 Tax=Pyruvatibacter sp. HU-CL02332 TaxID=3127650 RepID=UPI00310ACC4F
MTKSSTPLIRKTLARLLAGVSTAALAVSAASATPANGTFVAGGAGGSITPSGGDVTINTGTDPRSVITWDSFNIDNGDTVIFNQLNNQSIALNKVTGPLAQSTIDGILQSNGHVWILNPAGVAFGANANIDVGALLATTADIDNATFMATDPTTGTFTFTDAGGTGAIIVANGADLDTTGLLALVAPMVTNSGDLTSSHGDVLLGGAEAFRIKFASTARNNGAAFNELLVTDFIVDGGSSTVAAGGDVVHQTSTGRAIGGRVIADASRVGGGAFLNMEGLVEAQNVGTLSGDVMLLGGVDITGGVLGAAATDAVKTDNMTIVAPGTASLQGTAVTIGNAVGPLNTGGNTNSSTGAISVTGTTGDVTIAADLQATAGDVNIQATNGNIDVAELIAQGSITVSGRDIDLTNGNTTGTTTVLRTTNGALSLTATNGDISKGAGIVDIDVGTNVTLSGNATGATSSWAIDAVPGTVTADDFNVQFVRIGATGSVGVGDVTASQSAEVISTASTLKVGNVSSDNNITLSGTDVDLTGTGGSLQSTGGTVSVTATGGGANNISATGAIDIDADVVSLSGATTGTSIDIDADNGTVTANAITASAGAVSVDATGNVDVDDMSATTTARVVSSAGAVDVGNVTGPGGITVSGTDVDLTGTGGSLQSTGGAVSVTASGGGANNISSAGAIDIDGDAVVLSGPLTGTAVDIDADNGAVTANAVTASAGSASIDATGDVDVDNVSATTTARVVSSAGAVDVGNVTSPGGITISGTDVDLTGTGGSLQSTGGTVSVTASGGGVNNISSAGGIDVDGDVVALSGPVTGTTVDIDADNGTVTANAITASAGSASVDATGDVDVDDVSATTTASVVSGAGAVDVGDITSTTGVTVSGTDVDLTGTNGDVQASNGAVSVTASGGGANNISSAGAIDIDGNSVTLAGNTSATGNITIDAATGNASTTGSITSTGGLVSVIANAGNAVLQAVQALTGVTLAANQISATTVQGSSVGIDADVGTVTTTSVTATGGSAVVQAAGDVDVDNVSATTTARVVSTTGAVDVGNVTGATGITISATDVDLTGAGGSLQSTGGTILVVASGGGANNISAAGAMDIDGDAVVLSGPLTGTAIDIDADNGAVTANAITASAGSASIDATGNVDVDNVSATTTVRVVSSTGAVDVGDVTGPAGVTVSGTDIDFTGTNGDVVATAGTVALTATGGGANDISSAGAIDIDGNVVTLSGNMSATGDITIDAATGNASTNGSITSTGGLVSVVANAGNAVLQAIQASTGITLTANQVSATSIQGGSVDIDADAGPVTATSIAATGGAVAVDATGNIDVDNVSATTSVRVVSSTGSVDVGDVSAVTQADISGTDIDLTGAGGSVQVTTGPANLTATGGGASNISAAGAIDIDAHQVNLSGATTGASIDIDATNGPVNGGTLTATGGSVSVDSSNGIDVDDVSATTTVRVVSTLGAVDVGNVTGPAGVTISGTDVDLTGAGGSVQSANGATSLSATGGGANNISAAGAMDIDGDSIQLSGPVVAGGAVALTADVTVISSGGVVDVTGTSVTVNGPVNGAGGVALSGTTGNVSADSAVTSAGGTVALSAVNGDIDVTSVSGATGATFVAQDIDVTGSINAGAGPASLTATAGDISTPGLLDIDGGSISLTGTVQAGTGIDLDASTGGITATGGDMATTAGSADLRAPAGTVSIQGLNAPGGISLVGAAVNYAGALVTQGQVNLEALTGALTGGGASSVVAPNGGLTARAIGGAATLNNVMIGGDLSLVGGSSTMTGASTVGGTATLQALTGNVHVAGSVAATGGILLIEAPSGSAVINSIASNTDVSLVVLDLDLTGTISAGDQFNLTPAGTGRTIIIGGSGGTDGVTLRRPQGFTLDASEVTRIIASKLQINAGANDLALLDATFDPAALQSLFLGADVNARIIAAGNVTGLPHLQLGFVDGAANARPGLILVSGALGKDTAADRLASLRLESSEDIVIGTQAFLDEFERAGGDLDLSTLGEPDLARFNGTQDHVFIAADQLRLFAPGEIVQLNTGTSFVGAGVVFGEAPAGEGTIVNTGGGPERVNLFGTVIRSTGERVTSFEAGLEPNLLGPGLSQNGELRLNLCVIGDSSSCSIAILREAQESARSRNSALSSLTNSTLFGFEDDDDDDDEEEDLGGVAGSGNEGLWGVGLP